MPSPTDASIACNWRAVPQRLTSRILAPSAIVGESPAVTTNTARPSSPDVSDSHDALVGHVARDRDDVAAELRRCPRDGGFVHVRQDHRVLTVQTPRHPPAPMPDPAPTTTVCPFTATPSSSSTSN